MQTDEIVRRLLNRPVTPDRALKVLHLLETPTQRDHVVDALTETYGRCEKCGERWNVDECPTCGGAVVGGGLSAALIVDSALTPSVVAAHFTRYRR